MKVVIERDGAPVLVMKCTTREEAEQKLHAEMDQIAYIAFKCGYTRGNIERFLVTSNGFYTARIEQ